MCHNKVLQITLHVAPSTNATHFGIKKGLILDISNKTLYITNVLR